MFHCVNGVLLVFSLCPYKFVKLQNVEESENLHKALYSTVYTGEENGLVDRELVILMPKTDPVLVFRFKDKNVSITF